MSVSRWHMHRMGLVDFWCYDDEVFEFENGHMLLRGSNGSGKSVTMQSFIPLLLDGNKSSERLDPFGTRARKIDTYLIDENSDRDERIGYLYLEFKREDSELYKTIGMGLRARRGKPLDSWYFVIEDNRRVGIDFSLMQNHLTLSEKQLKNILGDQVISLQRDYMKRVNDALFGFENLDDYGDAISLLLQVRSPKLSNSLSPQKISEILSSSLQPLSDEDLRPMSEAIVNMDNLQDQLESLKQSLTAAKKLEDVYQAYNKALLVEKWNKYTKENHEYDVISQEITQKIKEQQQFLKDIENNSDKLTENKVTQEVKRNELSALKNSDVEKWMETIIKLEKELVENSSNLEKKTNQFDQKENQYQDSRVRMDKYTSSIEEKAYNCEKYIKQMNDLNEGLSLSEHIAIVNCFEQQVKEFNFAYSRQQFKALLNQVNNGLDLWKSYSQQSEKIDFYEDQEGKKQEQLLHIQSQMEQEELHYQNVVEEYIEGYYRYSEQNKVLKLSTTDLNTMRSNLVNYEETRNYLSVRKIVEQVYNEISKEKIEKQVHLSTKIQNANVQIAQWTLVKNELESLPDLEPEKTHECKLNRQYMEKNHIPYRPLYQILDFDENMPLEKRRRAEELLSAMRLLDAVIVHKDYQKQIQEFPAGCQDFYLWTTKNVQELSTVCISKLDSQEDFKQILQDLCIENNNEIYVSEKYFRSGVIEGSLSLQQDAMFIGYESRLKIKEEKLAALTKQISEMAELRDSYLAESSILEQELDTLIIEYESFVDEKQLKSSLDKVDSLRKENNSVEKTIAELQENIAIERETLQKIYLKIQEIADQLFISAQQETFLSYKIDLQEYQNCYEAFKDEYTGMLEKINFKQMEEEMIVQLQEDLDNLRYDMDNLQYKLKVASQEKEILEKKLDDSGYKDIAHQLETLQKDIEILEQEKTHLEKNISVLETKCEQIDKDIQDKNIDKEVQYQRLSMYKDIFNQEMEYHFVFDENYDEKELGDKCKELMSSLGNKKNIADYQDQLQRVYFEQNPYLNQYNIVQEKVDLCHEVEDLPSRLLLKATSQGKRIAFLELIDILKENIEMQELLIVDEDRHIFEEILVNTIGKKIRERIQVSRQWVEKIQNYMNDMNTSSGLQLSLKWRSKKAVDDQQLDTQKLVELLEIDYHILKESDRKKISNHFRSKISDARKMSQDENTTASFHQLMKEVMDYRKWFDFTLFAKKPNENRKELTSHVFYAYSGGEKALSMYVPLFSAVAAKLESARKDAPLLIALDEAFAGVDENNIDNMFELITKFGFDYIMNSQVLWGDYPSCRSLAIYELFRPNNAPFVTVIAYTWNGHVKKLRKL